MRRVRCEDWAMSDPQNSVESQIDGRRLTGALRRESVKKNVAAIHVSGKLSLLQRKMANVLLLNAYDGLLSRRTHVIDARTLCVMIGYNSNDMDTLKEALRALVETTAEWDVLGDDGTMEWGVSALLASARLKGGICEYAYSPALADKLHDPKIFALINLSVQREFKSGYALALYENCYRFVRTGSTGWWDVAVFRRLMGVEESDYYKSFKQLNAKIIKPAVAEVNAVSNIRVTPEFRRCGRKVSQIRFAISERSMATPQQAPPAQAAPIAPEALAVDPVLERLRALGVSDRLARQWIADHGSAYVAEKLDYVADRSARRGIRSSAVGYLSAALRDDYRAAPRQGDPGRAAASATSSAAPIAGVEGETARREAARARLLALRRRHRAHFFDVVEALVAQRSPTQRDADRRQFLAMIRDEVDREDFRQRGWRSAVNIASIAAFWEEVAPGQLPRLEDLAMDEGVDLAATERAARGEDGATRATGG
jgi:hypothetical protein